MALGSAGPRHRRARSVYERQGSSAGQGIRAGRRDQPLRDPVIDVLEAIERPAFQLDRRAQRTLVELHVGEVLEQNVNGLVRRALELLAGQRPPVTAREGVEPLLTDDRAEMLHAHLVDPLVDGRDELDHRDDLAVEDAERLGEDDQGHRAAVPDVLDIGDRVPLEAGPEVEVLIPLRDAERQVAQLVGRDVDAPRGEAVALLRRERAVVADEVRDRVGHRVS